MAKFGLIGYPAAGSQSPALFSAAYGGRYPYEIIEEEDFALAFDKFMREDFRAVNVTAPHKLAAAAAADWRSPEVERIGAANILVKTAEGVKAYNSDCLAVKQLIDGLDVGTAIIIGLGGAGRAALHACRDCGLKTSVLHHDEITGIGGDGDCPGGSVFRDNPVAADLIVYTLPRAVPGIEIIRCKYLIEANYIDPACSNLPGVDHYIGGIMWLKAQAIKGYGLMTGELPDPTALIL